MNQDLITHLTKDAFKKAQINVNSAMTVFIQVNTQPEKFNESKKFFKVKLSDGFFIQEFHTQPPLDNLKVGNIIKTQIIFNKKVFAMLNSSLIYECDVQIGIPKPYSFHE